MQIIPSLHSISTRFDALFCDIWGCLHNGVASFSPAVHSLQRFRHDGGAVLLLTNAPRPWQDVKRQISLLGVPDNAWDVILSSGDVAKAALFAGRVGTRVFHIGPERDSGFFAPDDFVDNRDVERVSFDKAEGIVCTGLFDDNHESPEDYRNFLFQAVARKMPFLCANPDRIVHRGNRKIHCAGAIGDLYTALGGDVLMFGKPQAAIYHLARKRLQDIRPQSVAADRILCIGDNVATDLKGAVEQSLPSLFVLGGLAASLLDTESRPDPSRVKSFFDRHGVEPDYVIGHLC